ncbi:hypothetical protein ABH912_000492 [Pseudomonas sp. BT76 TE3572]|uniref:GTPase-associated system all-helical protein GASH n=1 Tax=Pseudomonas sp. BT76 TE3572 TaxID=3349325 RepID=UPI003D1AD7A7
MAVPVEPMHQNFAQWYDSVSMGDDTVRRHGRWEGLLNVVANVNSEIVEALLRLAYGTRQTPLQSTIQTIRQHFKTADETFEMDGNNRELQVLAGACLAVLMEDTNSNQAERAALAVTTAALGRGRTTNLPMDLASLGEQAIDLLSEANRERPSLTTSREHTTIDFAKSVAKVNEQPDWAGVGQAFELAAETTRTAFSSLAKQQTQAIIATEHFIRVQDEELQMLWWLTGQRSKDYNCAFDTLPVDAQPFVFASELANATEFLPGPPSVNAILSRAGLKERKKIALTAAVNAPTPQWLQGMVEEIDPSPVSTPIHYAIKRQLEIGAGDAWVAAWASATGINAGHSLSRLTLGELFYRERLLILFG